MSTRFMSRRARQFAHIANGVEMIEGFKVVAQGFASDGDALFNHHRGLDRRQGVPLDGV